MCIIIIKKAGIELPSRDILKSAWNNNPDGGGYMIPSTKGKKVVISKGFMKFDDFMKSINKVKHIKDIPMIIHFRITTHGGTSKANTHPFPLTSNVNNLQKTRMNSNIGIAHNGIIDIKPRKDLSDTMEFIASELSLFASIVPLWYKDIKSLDYIEGRITSKLAIMDGSGYIATIGKFFEDEGIMYSNTTYMEYVNYNNMYNYGYSELWDIEEMDCSYSKDTIEELEIMGLMDYEISSLSKMITESNVLELIDYDEEVVDTLLGMIYKII